MFSVTDFLDESEVCSFFTEEMPGKEKDIDFLHSDSETQQELRKVFSLEKAGFGIVTRKFIMPDRENPSVAVPYGYYSSKKGFIDPIYLGTFNTKEVNDFLRNP